MGPTALLPPEGRRAEDFFALKNPTASAGFEPANLGIKASTLPLDHRSRGKDMETEKALGLCVEDMRRRSCV